MIKSAQTSKNDIKLRYFKNQFYDLRVARMYSEKTVSYSSLNNLIPFSKIHAWYKLTSATILNYFHPEFRNIHPPATGTHVMTRSQ